MSTKTREGLVSVLMVVRNEAERIEAAIESVLGQTYRHLELIVIDGDSCDGTRETVERLAAQDPRVVLVTNPRRVIPSGLNRGLGAAGGEFVARLDGHSRWNREYLADGVDRLSRRPDAAGVGGQRYGVAATRTGRVIAAALASPFGVGNSIYHYSTEPQDTDHATSAIYRTAAARQVAGWDENLLVNEDVDFDHRLRGLGFVLLYDPAMRTAWQVRETLPDLFRQYRRYGRGKAAMVHKNGPRAVRVRHLAAPALVTALACSLAGLAAGHRAPATALLILYTGAVGAGLEHAHRRSAVAVVDLSTLAGAFASMHLGWGIGFLEGVALHRAPAAASRR